MMALMSLWFSLRWLRRVMVFSQCMAAWMAWLPQSIECSANLYFNIKVRYNYLIYLQISHLSESCLGDLSITCIVQAEGLFHVWAVRFQFACRKASPVLIFRNFSLDKWDLIIEMSFHSIFAHLMFFLSDHIVWANIMTWSSKMSHLKQWHETAWGAQKHIIAPSH